MWNLKPASEFINQQYTTRNQLMHLEQLQQTGKMIQNEQPYQSSYSLSRNVNKYTKQNNKKIWYENQNLLDKMLVIEQKQLPVHEKHKIYSLQEYFRKRTKIINEQANYKLLQRLENTGSNYNKKKQDNDYKKHMQYRKNLQSKQRTINIDYTKKAHQLKLKLLRERGSTQSSLSFRNPKLSKSVNQTFQTQPNMNLSTQASVQRTNQSQQNLRYQQNPQQQVKQFNSKQIDKVLMDSSYFAGSPSTNASYSQKKRPNTSSQNYSPGYNKMRKEYFQFPDL